MHGGVQHIHRHISGNIHIHASAGHGVQCHGIQCQTESGIGIGSGKRDPACTVGHIQMRECHIIFRRHTEDAVCTCAVQRHIGNAVTIHIPVDLQREFHAACRRTDLKGTAESDGPFAVRKDRTVKINDIIAVGCRRVDPDQCFPQRGHAVGIIHRILQRGDRDDRTCRSFIHSKIAGNDLQYIIGIIHSQIIADDHTGICSGGGNIHAVFDLEFTAHSDNIIADRCADRVFFRIDLLARRNGLIRSSHSQFRLFHSDGLLQNRTIRQHIIRAESVDSRRDGVFARVMHGVCIVVGQRHGQIFHFLAVAVKHLHDHCLICTVVGIISGDRTPIQCHFHRRHVCPVHRTDGVNSLCSFRRDVPVCTQLIIGKSCRQRSLLCIRQEGRERIIGAACRQRRSIEGNCKTAFFCTAGGQEISLIAACFCGCIDRISGNCGNTAVVYRFRIKSHFVKGIDHSHRIGCNAPVVNIIFHRNRFAVISMECGTDHIDSSVLRHIDHRILIGRGGIPCKCVSGKGGVCNGQITRSVDRRTAAVTDIQMQSCLIPFECRTIDQSLGICIKRKRTTPVAGGIAFKKNIAGNRQIRSVLADKDRAAIAEIVR